MAAAICPSGEKRTTNIREREAENNRAGKLKEITHLVFLPEVNEFCICKHGQMQIEDCQLLHTCTWFIYYLSRGMYLEGVTSVCKSHAIPSEELMHGSILPVTIPPPGQPPGQVQPFGPGGAELFETVL